MDKDRSSTAESLDSTLYWFMCVVVEWWWWRGKLTGRTMPQSAWKTERGRNDSGGWRRCKACVRAEWRDERSDDFPPQWDSSVGGMTRDADEEAGGGAHMDNSQLFGNVPGGSPPPLALEEALGRDSISSPVSLMGGMRASSSDRGTNSGWAMKLWMELRDSGLSSPAYRELRNAFTTLIWNK